MIELFEQNERMQDRQSSKGNQLKWENAGIWYKAHIYGFFFRHTFTDKIHFKTRRVCAV